MRFKRAAADILPHLINAKTPGIIFWDREYCKSIQRIGLGGLFSGHGSQKQCDNQNGLYGI
jgi:hypothetical protein